MIGIYYQAKVYSFKPNKPHANCVEAVPPKSILLLCLVGLLAEMHLDFQSRRLPCCVNFIPAELAG